MGKPDFDDDFEMQDPSADAAITYGGGLTSLKVPSGLGFFKPKKSGSHTISIIPFLVTEEALKFYGNQLKPGKWWWKLTYNTHQRIGVNSETYVCIAGTFGQRCPICEDISRLNRSPHKEMQARSAEIKRKIRQLYLVYDHDDPDKGIQLWEVAHWNFGKQLDEYIAESGKDKERYERHYHPTKGSTIRIYGKEESIGEGKNTVYKIHSFLKREAIELPDNILDHGYDLHSMIRAFSYDDLKMIHQGHAEESDVLGEDIDLPKRPDTGNGRHTEPVKTEKVGKQENTEKSEKPRKPAPLSPERTAEHSERARKEREEKAHQFASLDRVAFKFDGNDHEGVILKINTDKNVALVKFTDEEGEERRTQIDFDDLTLLESDSTFDLKDVAEEKPKSKAKAPAKNKKDDGGWDDDDDDRSFRR